MRIDDLLQNYDVKGKSKERMWRFLVRQKLYCHSSLLVEVGRPGLSSSPFAILNGYTSTNANPSEAPKLRFYSVQNKAKKKLDETYKFKTIVIGDLNTTHIFSKQNFWVWESALLTIVGSWS